MSDTQKSLAHRKQHDGIEGTTLPPAGKIEWLLSLLEQCRRGENSFWALSVACHSLKHSYSERTVLPADSAIELVECLWLLRGHVELGMPGLAEWPVRGIDAAARVILAWSRRPSERPSAEAMRVYWARIRILQNVMHSSSLLVEHGSLLTQIEAIEEPQATAPVH